MSFLFLYKLFPLDSYGSFFSPCVIDTMVRDRCRELEDYVCSDPNLSMGPQDLWFYLLSLRERTVVI